MITYDYVEPKQTPEEAVRFLQEVLFPLCQDFWDARGKSYYKADKWDIPMLDFVQMWMQRTLVIIAARDAGGEAMGFLIGGLVRPFFYKTNILKVEVWHGKTQEVRDGLFAHLGSILKYFSVDRVSVPDFGDGVPALEGFGTVIEEPARTVAK
ncbi:MAG: hypothetical protein LBQ12_14225 [Deltaproteobacteria bacterium]|jgi:hypothetical protein|nr:hypothetical protein [Deltaproteobacteria bacterium]